MSLSLFGCQNNTRTHFSYEFESKNKNLSDSKLDISINYPHFQHEYTDSIIDRHLDTMQKQFMKHVNKDELSENWKFEQNIKFTCSYTHTGFLSVLFKDYQYTGGAHGNTILRAIILNPDERHEFHLKDFFKGDILSSIQLPVRKKLRASLSSDAFLDEGTTTLSDFAIFTLSEDSIFFHFSPYQVASYSDGDQSVSISLSELENFIWPTSLVR